MRILQKESELDEIVKLVGVDALSKDDRLTLEIARSVREDFLQQNAFDVEDSFTALKKQLALIELILFFRDKAKEAIDNGADIEKVSSLPVRERIGRAKITSDKDVKEVFSDIRSEIETSIKALYVK